MSNFDVKLVIVGESSCGKSALLQRLLTGRFARDLPPTYGTEFGAKRVEAEAPEGGGALCRPSLGVWDTSGAPRFHEMSRRFLRGADAVLVCWDPSSRASWDSLRAWVADARAEDPSAHIFLAATKADLVEVPGQPGSTAGAVAGGGAAGAGPARSAQPVPAGAAQARVASAEQAGMDLGVSVERWQGGLNGSGTLVADVQPPQQQEQQQQEEQQQQQQQEEQQQDEQQQQQQEEQQQQQWQRRVAQQQGHHVQAPPDVPPQLELSLAARAAAATAPEGKRASGKLPLPGGSSGTGEAPPPAAPVTPVRAAKRPQSPAGGEPAAGAAPEGQPAAGTPEAASGRASPAERVAAEHAAAAAAELVASLTGRELPSPFAAAARGPSSEQGASSERGAPSQRGAHSEGPSPSPSPAPAEGGQGPSRPARPALPGHAVQWASPELSPRSTARSADEWEGEGDEQGQRGQLPGERAAAAPPALPPAAVDAYCSAQGDTAARMMWLSARTGQGVGPAFARIAQEVLSARWSRQRGARFGEQRQEATQRGGRGLLPRRSTTAGTAPVRPLGAGPAARATAGAAVEYRARYTDGRPAPPARAVSGLATAAPRRAGSGARAPSGSPSPSPGDDSWVREYSVWGSQLAGQPRGPEEQSCRMA